MSASNVRNIESLQAFHDGLAGLADDWDKTLQEVRMIVHRAEAHFTQDRPAYWRKQKQLAERELTEAKESLSQKQAAARARDRVPATEAAQRVNRAQARVRQCEAKQRAAKHAAVEVAQQCDALLGPLADVVEHCEVLLPTAARQLQTLIDQLRVYAEQPKGKDIP